MIIYLVSAIDENGIGAWGYRIPSLDISESGSAEGSIRKLTSYTTMSLALVDVVDKIEPFLDVTNEIRICCSNKPQLEQIISRKGIINSNIRVGSVTSKAIMKLGKKKVIVNSLGESSQDLQAIQMTATELEKPVDWVYKFLNYRNDENDILVEFDKFEVEELIKKLKIETESTDAYYAIESIENYYNRKKGLTLNRLNTLKKFINKFQVSGS